SRARAPPVSGDRRPRGRGTGGGGDSDRVRRSWGGESGGWLATEQWASFLSEAILGEWGGYEHPLWGLITFNDPRVVAYFGSTESTTVRDFYLGYATRSFDMTRMSASQDIPL